MLSRTKVPAFRYHAAASLSLWGTPWQRRYMRPELHFASVCPCVAAPFQAPSTKHLAHRVALGSRQPSPPSPSTLTQVQEKSAAFLEHILRTRRKLRVEHGHNCLMLNGRNPLARGTWKAWERGRAQHPTNHESSGSRQVAQSPHFQEVETGTGKSWGLFVQGPGIAVL